MVEMRRIIGQDSRMPKPMVHGADRALWEPNGCILETKFQVFTLCTDFILNVSLNKFMVMIIGQKTRGMEKIKSNNCEIQKIENLMYSEIKIVANGRVQKIAERITKKNKTKNIRTF